MGYQLVGAALQPAWGFLRDRDRLVLVAMCLAALDETDNAAMPARRYWAGTAYIVLQLDGINPDSDRYRSASESVRRSLRALEAAGAIQRIKSAANGRRSEYEITCRQAQLPVDKADQINAPAPPHSGSQPHHTVGLSPTTQWVSAPPHSGSM